MFRFMAAIEVITSQKKEIIVKKKLVKQQLYLFTFGTKQ